MYADIHKNTIRHEYSYKTTGGKHESNIGFFCVNRNGHHDTKLRTQRRIIGQHNKLKKKSNTDSIKKWGIQVKGIYKTHAMLLIYIH